MTPSEASNPRVGGLVCYPDKPEVVGLITRYDDKAAYVRWPDHGRWHRFISLTEFELIPYSDFLPGPGEPFHDPLAWRASLAGQKNASDW